MSKSLVVGCFLVIRAACAFADTSTGQLGVQINLRAASVESCTGSTASRPQGAQLDVRCSPGVVVNVSRPSAPPDDRFLPGYRPARDSLLPDYCRSEISRTDQTARITCRLDDKRQIFAGSEVDEGWEIESRLYAVDTEDAATKTARLRLEEQERGILTGIRFASAGGKALPVELLVSF